MRSLKAGGRFAVLTGDFISTVSLLIAETNLCGSLGGLDCFLGLIVSFGLTESIATMISTDSWIIRLLTHICPFAPRSEGSHPLSSAHQVYSLEKSPGK